MFDLVHNVPNCWKILNLHHNFIIFNKTCTSTNKLLFTMEVLLPLEISSYWYKLDAIRILAYSDSIKSKTKQSIKKNSTGTKHICMRNMSCLKGTLQNIIKNMETFRNKKRKLTVLPSIPSKNFSFFCCFSYFFPPSPEHTTNTFNWIWFYMQRKIR